MDLVIAFCGLAYLALIGWVIYLMFKNHSSLLDYEEKYQNSFIHWECDNPEYQKCDNPEDQE
jgi:glycopeptide antibiotics resistance protein